MKQVYFAVYDSAAAYFLNPFPAPTDGAAVREFEKAVRNPDTPMSQNPEHFKLFRLGKWDNTTGSFEDENNTMVSDALAVVARDKTKVTQISEIGE